MIGKGSSFFKPGTVFLFVLIALMGFGMYTWADASIGEAGERSLEDQNDALVCSNLDISKSGIRISQNETKLFFKVNRDVEEVNLNFEGKTNISKTVSQVNPGKLQSVTANVSSFSHVSLKVPACDRVFRFE